jgi:hypothetical protein
MAALIKELLLDYALNRLSVDMRSDLTIAIQNALSSRVFTLMDIQYLNQYLSGYTASEIALQHNMLTVEIEEILERVFTAIEEYSGYTDTNFIHKLEMTNKYRKSGLNDMNTFLIEHSKHYITHELEVR